MGQRSLKERKKTRQYDIKLFIASANAAFPKGGFGEEDVLRLSVLYVFSGSSSYQGMWTITKQVVGVVFFFSF